MQELIGICCGGAVAVFGIWAFLRGQRSMAQIMRNGMPDGLAGPAELLRNTARAKEENPEFEYESQLRSLFSDGAEHGGKKEGGR